MEWQQDAIERLEQYATSRGLQLSSRLGQGYDGVVFSTVTGTAIKSLAFERLYLKERDVYLRLRENNVDHVCGFAVPTLIAYDDCLWVIEMEIVSPPFVLDFAGAYLDRPPDYPDDILEEWEEDKREQFGEERWEIVQSIMATFRRFKIFLADVKPGNITFED